MTHKILEEVTYAAGSGEDGERRYYVAEITSISNLYYIEHTCQDVKHFGLTYFQNNN